MKIVVCVKHVPDAQGDRRFTDDHTVDREGVDGLLSELDDYAVEEALTIAEARSASGEDSTVTVLCTGPEGATDAVRKALQMGADAGVHVNDPIEVNVYRIGGIMPGLVLGILPFFLSLITGNNGLLWFSILQTAAASGDWVILLMLRNVKNGTLVEDHPTRAGCYSSPNEREINCSLKVNSDSQAGVI